MSKEYTSSIISKYGDVDNVREDVRTINDIIARQGTTLLIDVMAENTGNTAIKYNMTASERDTLIQALTDKLNEALKERL